MRQLFVAGNWKMCGNKASIAQLMQGILKELPTLSITCAVFPPFVYLDYVANLIKGSHCELGAQNVNAATEGAFTGEIAAPMLVDMGCRYVLVGHSERRLLYGETDAVIGAKFKAAKAAQLTPILCVGETLAQREAGQTAAVVLAQVASVVQVLAGKTQLLRNAVLAYEPVWAIGTGKTATPEQAQEVHALIRQFIASHDQDLALQLRILYGGSVKASNAQALFAMPDIDGGLIGGASLQAQEFLQICYAGK